MSKNKFICNCNAIDKEIVDKARKNLLNDRVLENIALFFKIIGDKTRCKNVSTLISNPMCVCDLCNVLSMSKSSVSHQLTKMRKLKVLKFEKIGNKVIYSLEDEHVKKIFLTTKTHLSHEEFL